MIDYDLDKHVNSFNHDVEKATPQISIQFLKFLQ